MAGDVIMYEVEGRWVFHDPERVLLLPSDNGRVKFVGNPSIPDGEYKVATSLITYQVSGDEKMEVIGAHAHIKLVRHDDGSSGNV